MTTRCASPPLPNSQSSTRAASLTEFPVLALPDHQAPLFEGTEEEIAAAKKIQAMHRGRAARADVEKLKADKQAAKEEAEAAAKSLKLAEETALLAAEAEREAGEITGTEDEQQAAVKLQAMQRGRKARARVAEHKAQKLAAEAVAAAAEATVEEAEVSAASAAGAVEEEVSFEGTDEEHGAAAKLQAVQRGRAARAKLRADRAAAAAKVAEVEAQMAQTDAAEAVHFEGTEEEQSAATKLQAVHRGRKAREDVDRLKKQREAAAEAQKKVEEAQASATDEGASHLEMLVAQKAKFDEEAEQIEQEFAECKEENQEAIDAAEMEAAEAEAAAEAAEASAEAVEEEPIAEEEAEAEEAEAEEPEELDEEAVAAAAAAAKAAAKDAERQNDAEKMFDGENHGQVPDAKARMAMLTAKLMDVRAKSVQFEAEISDVNAALDIEGLEKGFFAAVQLREWRITHVERMKVVARKALADAAKAKGDWKIWEKRTEEREETEEEDFPAVRAKAVAELKDLIAARDDADAKAQDVAKELEDMGPEDPEPEGPKNYKADDYRQKPEGPDELDRSVMEMYHSFGFESVKRNNLAYLADNVIIFTVGNMTQILNLETQEQTYLPGIDGRGVGMVMVHPTREYFAVGEKGTNPNVYMYEYPSLRLVRVMTGGTEEVYSCGRFSPDGSKLATVGNYPDFMITIWDWDKESIVLRSKAFSQEVYDVSFSPVFPGYLYTSGTGHIRFWKMAGTFTGLKLQGDIGRFGNVDLSDISGYAELPDGKVVSGTETGTLLIWDGGLIRAVIVRPDGEGGAFKPCHEGMIEVVRFDNATKTISTTGADGHVRWWDYATVRDAEPDDDQIEVLIEPIREAAIGDGDGGLCNVKSIITTEPDHWLVQDANGGIVRVAVGEDGEIGESTRLTSFHGGSINGMDVSAVSDHAVTAGSDGTVRLWAYAEKREVYRHKFCAGCTFVQMAPAYVDGSQRTIVAGFDDGVVRILLRCSDGFKVIDCFKPHSKKVTVVRFSPDGNVLATGSSDGTVFFLAAKYPKSPPKAPKLPGVTLTPIGFAKAPGGVSAIQWHENMKDPKLLVGCESGHAFEMKSPNWKPGQPDSVDSTVTYEFEPTATHYKFNRPVPTAMSIVEGRYPPVGDERDAADAEEKAAIIEQKRVMELEAEQLQKEMDEAERIAVYAVRHIGYVPFSGGNFELALGGEAAGKIWECQFGAKDPLRGTKTRQSALTLTRASVSGKLSVQAFEDGTVRVAPSRGKSYWVGAVHDGIYGSVTGAAVTRDDSFLLSTSSDGSFFAQKIGAGLLAERVPASDAEEVATVAEEPTSAVEDITDPTKYSYEEEKIKLAEDIAREAAEEAKLGVRGYVYKLRGEFQVLLAENEAKPPHERLPREAFEVDPGIHEVVEAETQGKMEMVKAEFAWLKERANLQLKRLQDFFLDPVESERVVLRSFGSGRRSFAVTSFRVARFSEALRADIERCHTTELQRKTAGAGARAGLTPGKSFRKNVAEDDTEPKVDPEAELMSEGKYAEKRAKRKAREAEWREFNASKPDPKYENPDDLAAIEEANRTRGDFKLKSEPDYVVPEEDQQFYDRKRRQMLLLEEAVHEIKMEFNRRFLALRAVRKSAVEDVQSSAKRIAEITVRLDDADQPEGFEALSVLTEPFSATPLADEYPAEFRAAATDEELKAYDEEQKAAAAAASGGGDFGGFGGGGAKKDEKEEKEGDARKSAGKDDANDEYSLAAKAKAKAHPRESLAAAALATPFEEAENATVHAGLKHERAYLVTKRRQTVASFDAILRAMRREKADVEYELKVAEMKQLTLNRELIMLKKFEQKENELDGRLEESIQAHADLCNDIERREEELHLKIDERDGVTAKRDKVIASFDNLVSSDDEHRSILFKYFLKKVRRVKPRDSDAGSDSEEEDDDDSEYDSEEDEEEFLPEGCEEELYDSVLELRERRLDEHYVIKDLTKEIDAMKKELDGVKKKEKAANVVVEKLEVDLENYRLEKQRRLNNDVDVTVMLRSRQLEYLHEGKLPTSMDNGLVFSRETRNSLRRRIDELIEDKSALRETQAQLRKDFVAMQNTKEEYERRNAGLDARAIDTQMFKYGSLIDLEKLEVAMIPKKPVEALKAKLRDTEQANAAEMRQWAQALSDAVDEMHHKTAANTECLEQVADLTRRQRDLTRELVSTRKTAFVDPEAAKKRETAERDHLVAVVNEQAREIEKLRNEVGFLSVKGNAQVRF